MRVSKILPGDIVRGMVQLKNRPCIVLEVEENVVIACPLTTESPKVSKLKAKTTKALSENRFLKTKSYFTFASIQIPIQDAKDNMLGMVEKRTLRTIKDSLRKDFVKILNTDY